MATYHRIETPETNKKTAEKTAEKEYSIITSEGTMEFPERYIRAAAAVEALRRLCAMEEKNSEYPTLEVKLIRAVIGDE